jgi:AhpD family alkylhydroperoxidase
LCCNTDPFAVARTTIVPWNAAGEIERAVGLDACDLLTIGRQRNRIESMFRRCSRDGHRGTDAYHSYEGYRDMRTQHIFEHTAASSLTHYAGGHTEMSAKRDPIEYKDASPEVRAVYDDIMATRKTDWVNNFWKVLAHDPVSLRRIWANIKEVMGPGTIDPLVKEMLYVAISASNGCRYCIASHGAAARNKGMTDAQYSELLAIVGLANETNRLVTALDVPVDERFLS